MSIHGLIICGGITHQEGKIPRWVFKTMSNWCNGCEAGYPHYPGDIPSYYRDDCEHYSTRPIDHEVASNVLALSPSKTHDQMWGLTTDSEPWDEETS